MTPSGVLGRTSPRQRTQGTLQSLSSLRPCWDAILNILYSHGTW